ncbi:MAG TPA: peptide chain release factor 1 [Candidatus Saccharibacteria bacterium]|nr:peptide chain release factor 1 [Candidatus Saccharibacteria bacterium]HMT39366.1 peptide chain release factor 1 [Candidatus Saccharibacteria bacterium]
MINDEKINEVKAQLQEIEAQLADPKVYTSSKSAVLVASQRDLIDKLTLFVELKKTSDELDEAKTMLNDPEMKQLAQETIDQLEPKLAELEDKVKVAMLPVDPNEHKNAIIEIRAGAGGDESSIFAGDLLRMYLRYAETHGLRSELLSESSNTSGGYKEVIVQISGENAYGRLKYESGVHRVQRIPATESAGRIHTSTATVAVLPEAEESDIEINPNDLRIDVFRSGGHGGQSVNTTDSAVRITHLPTGIVATCQDEKSQLKNKLKAMNVLRSRLLDMRMQEEEKQLSDTRKSQIGTGDRSEKIRTYNYPQDRVTDHRINFTTHGLQKIIDGDLDVLFEALRNSEIQKNLDTDESK